MWKVTLSRERVQIDSQWFWFFCDYIKLTSADKKAFKEGQFEVSVLMVFLELLAVNKELNRNLWMSAHFFQDAGVHLTREFTCVDIVTFCLLTRIRYAGHPRLSRNYKTVQCLWQYRHVKLWSLYRNMSDLFSKQSQMVRWKFSLWNCLLTCCWNLMPEFDYSNAIFMIFPSLFGRICQSVPLKNSKNRFEVTIGTNWKVVRIKRMTRMKMSGSVYFDSYDAFSFASIQNVYVNFVYTVVNQTFH